MNRSAFCLAVILLCSTGAFGQSGNGTSDGFAGNVPVSIDWISFERRPN